MVKVKLSEKGVTRYKEYLEDKINDVMKSYLREPKEDPLYVKIQKERIQRAEDIRIYEGQLHEMMDIFGNDVEYFEDNNFYLDSNEYHIYNEEEYGVSSSVPIYDKTPVESKRKAREIANRIFKNNFDPDGKISKLIKEEGILEQLEG